MKRRKNRGGFLLFIIMVSAVVFTVSSARGGRDGIILVNADNPVPMWYKPELVDLGGGKQLDKTAAEQLEKMKLGAKRDGCSLVVSSAYRTKKYQKGLYEKQIAKQQKQNGYSRKKAEEEAARVVAKPGYSEHNLGLAVDIVAASDMSMEKSFELTKEGKWLAKHCAEYGFILRYPKGKEDITGIIYEPWHFRYVGQADAGKIMQSGVCLEEYLGKD